MPKFGRYDTVSRIHQSGSVTVWSARPADSEEPDEQPRFAVKLLRAGLLDTGLGIRTSGGGGFLDAVGVQQEVARADGEHWAPVHESGSSADGPYYVTDYYDHTLQDLIQARTELNAAALHHVVDSVVTGLVELQKACGRAHGSLGTPSVLICGKGDLAKVRVVLTDPMPSKDLPAGAAAADLHAVGDLIHRLVLHEPPDDAAHWPVESSKQWTRLGSAGEAWLELCNRLLDPNLAAGELTLEKVAETLRELPTRASRLPVAAVAGGGAAGLVLIAALVWALWPKSLPEMTEWRGLCTDYHYWFSALEQGLSAERRARWAEHPALRDALKALDEAKAAGAELDPRKIANAPDADLLAIAAEPPKAIRSSEEAREKAKRAFQTIDALKMAIVESASTTATTWRDERDWQRPAQYLDYLAQAVRSARQAALDGDYKDSRHNAMKSLLDVEDGLVADVEALWARLGGGAQAKLEASGDGFLKRFGEYVRAQTRSQPTEQALEEDIGDLRAKLGEVQQLAGKIAAYVERDWKTSVDRERFTKEVSAKWAKQKKPVTRALLLEWLGEARRYEREPTGWAVKLASIRRYVEYAAGPRPSGDYAASKARNQRIAGFRRAINGLDDQRKTLAEQWRAAKDRKKLAPDIARFEEGLDDLLGRLSKGWWDDVQRRKLPVSPVLQAKWAALRDQLLRGKRPADVQADEKTTARVEALWRSLFLLDRPMPRGLPTLPLKPGPWHKELNDILLAKRKEAVTKAIGDATEFESVKFKNDWAEFRQEFHKTLTGIDVLGRWCHHIELILRKELPNKQTLAKIERTYDSCLGHDLYKADPAIRQTLKPVIDQVVQLRKTVTAGEQRIAEVARLKGLEDEIAALAKTIQAKAKADKVLARFDAYVKTETRAVRGKTFPERWDRLSRVKALAARLAEWAQNPQVDNERFRAGSKVHRGAATTAARQALEAWLAEVPGYLPLPPGDDPRRKDQWAARLAAVRSYLTYLEDPAAPPRFHQKLSDKDRKERAAAVRKDLEGLEKEQRDLLGLRPVRDDKDPLRDRVATFERLLAQAHKLIPPPSNPRQWWDAVHERKLAASPALNGKWASLRDRLLAGKQRDALQWDKALLGTAASVEKAWQSLRRLDQDTPPGLQKPPGKPESWHAPLRENVLKLREDALAKLLRPAADFETPAFRQQWTQFRDGFIKTREQAARLAAELTGIAAALDECYLLDETPQGHRRALGKAYEACRQQPLLRGSPALDQALKPLADRMGELARIERSLGRQALAKTALEAKEPVVALAAWRRLGKLADPPWPASLEESRQDEKARDRLRTITADLKRAKALRDAVDSEGRARQQRAEAAMRKEEALRLRRAEIQRLTNEITQLANTIQQKSQGDKVLAAFGPFAAAAVKPAAGESLQAQRDRLADLKSLAATLATWAQNDKVDHTRFRAESPLHRAFKGKVARKTLEAWLAGVAGYVRLAPEDDPRTSPAWTSKLAAISDYAAYLGETDGPRRYRENLAEADRKKQAAALRAQLKDIEKEQRELVGLKPLRKDKQQLSDRVASFDKLLAKVHKSVPPPLPPKEWWDGVQARKLDASPALNAKWLSVRDALVGGKRPAALKWDKDVRQLATRIEQAWRSMRALGEALPEPLPKLPGKPKAWHDALAKSILKQREEALAKLLGSAGDPQTEAFRKQWAQFRGALVKKRDEAVRLAAALSQVEGALDECYLLDETPRGAAAPLGKLYDACTQMPVYRASAPVQQALAGLAQRIGQLRELEGSNDRQALAKAAGEAKRPELALAAWRRLGKLADPPWPASLDEGKRDEQIRARLRKLTARVHRSKEIDAEIAREALVRQRRAAEAMRKEGAAALARRQQAEIKKLTAEIAVLASKIQNKGKGDKILARFSTYVDDQAQRGAGEPLPARRDRLARVKSLAVSVAGRVEKHDIDYELFARESELHRKFDGKVTQGTLDAWLKAVAAYVVPAEADVRLPAERWDSAVKEIRSGIASLKRSADPQERKRGEQAEQKLAACEAGLRQMRALPWVSKHQKTVTDQASQLRESLESLTQHLRAEPLDAWLAHVEKRTKVAKSATLNQEWAKRRSELVARRGPAVRKAAGKKGYEEAYARLRSDVRRLEGFLSGLDDEKQLPRDIPAVAKNTPPKARRLAAAEQIAKDNGTGALEAVREQTLAAGLKHVPWGSDGLPSLSAADFQRQAQWQALCRRYGEGREDGGMLLLAVLETTSPKPEARLAAWRKLGGLNDWPLSPEELKAELALHAPIVRLCNELKATDAAKSGKLRAELDRETHRRWELAFNSLSAQAGPDLLADKAVAAALALSKTVPIRTEKLQAATRLRIHIYEFRQEVRRRRDEANKQWLPKAIGSLRAKLEALPKEFQGTPGVGKLVQALKGLQDADLAAPGLRQRLKEKGWLPELSLDKVLAERDLSRLGEGAAKYSEAVLGLAAAEPRVPKPDDPVEEEMAAIDALLERGNARAAVERIWKTLVEKWKTHRRTGWAELRAWVAQRESKHAALRRIGRHRLRSLDRQLKEYMEQEAGWQKTLKELEGTQDLREKIRKLETYVRWNYNSVYLADANKLLTKLRDELARRRPGRP